MSGVYSDFQGPGSVMAAQLAVEDFGGKVGDRPVEVLSGDHLNKPDVGLSTASSDQGAWATKCSSDWCFAAVREGAVSAAMGSTLLRSPGNSRPVQ